MKLQGEDFLRIAKLYDGIGWVPTIKGDLALSVVGNLDNSLYGDIDKHVVRFTEYRSKYDSVHYFVATSTLYVNDTIKGSRYSRIFRYFFIGQIGEKVLPDIVNNGISIEKLIDNRILNGCVLINTVDLENPFSRDEAKLIELIIKLKDNTRSNVGILEHDIDNDENSKIVKNCVNQWREIKSLFLKLKNADENKREITKYEKKFSGIERKEKVFKKYLYETLLFRDGLFLLKQVKKNGKSCDDNKEGRLELKKGKLPLPRLHFLTMLFVKSIFHFDYNHCEDHDCMLPITNTQVLEVDSKNYAMRFVHHQLSSMQDIIVEAKRENEISTRHELNGLLTYVKSFILVCKSRQLISDDDASDLSVFVNNQCLEANIRNSTKENFISRFFKDISIKGIIIIIISYLVMFLGIIDFFIDEYRKEFTLIVNKIVDFFNINYYYFSISICDYMLLLVIGSFIALVFLFLFKDRIKINKLKNIANNRKKEKYSKQKKNKRNKHIDYSLPLGFRFKIFIHNLPYDIKSYIYKKLEK